MNYLKICDHIIGRDTRSFIIAELSGNHNGSLSRALELVHAAKSAGADAVKLQTYTADTITIDAPQPWFRLQGGPWSGRTLYDLYKEASTPWEWHERIFSEAKMLDLICFSTPFDQTAVDFLVKLGAPAMKIASFEIVDLPLVTAVARAGKPIIMSTGLANLTEISTAVQAIRSVTSCPDVALLTCVSAYPCLPSDFHLANIPTLANVFSCVSGLSDHSFGSVAAVASVALGGRIIEKHLCISRNNGGPDSGFSMEPSEFAAMVRDVRAAEASCGNGIKFGAGQADSGSIQFRRSLFAVRDIPSGSLITVDDVRSIRPGNGLPPAQLPLVLGRRAATDIQRGMPLAWEMFR